MKRIAMCWPPVSCALCYYAALCVLLKFGTQHTQGDIIYPLDDTYIHMAVAKNFVEHHVWGITQYAFSSSTTSPLSTALLAVGYLLWPIRHCCSEPEVAQTFADQDVAFSARRVQSRPNHRQRKCYSTLVGCDGNLDDSGKRRIA